MGRGSTRTVREVWGWYADHCDRCQLIQAFCLEDIWREYRHNPACEWERVSRRRLAHCDFCGRRRSLPDEEVRSIPSWDPDEGLAMLIRSTNPYYTGRDESEPTDRAMRAMLRHIDSYGWWEAEFDELVGRVGMGAILAQVIALPVSYGLTFVQPTNGSGLDTYFAHLLPCVVVGAVAGAILSLLIHGWIDARYGSVKELRRVVRDYHLDLERLEGYRKDFGGNVRRALDQLQAERRGKSRGRPRRHA